MGMRVLNTTANKTEWTLNLFVQPDPFADTVDNAATVTAATGTAAVAAIDKVTKTKYGAATAKAVAVTEKAVKWVKKPTATGGTKAINIAGSVDVASYVYCAVAKSASRLRMLNTTNTTAAAKPAVAKAEVLDLTSA